MRLTPNWSPSCFGVKKWNFLISDIFVMLFPFIVDVELKLLYGCHSGVRGHTLKHSCKSSSVKVCIARIREATFGSEGPFV